MQNDIHTSVILEDITKPSPHTGQLYPKDELIKAIAAFKASNPLPVGELGHPSDFRRNVDFHRVSHKIIDTRLEGNRWVAEYTIMENLPCGKVAKDLIEGKVRLRLSPRAEGTLTEVNGQQIINDYKIFTFDLLSSPNDQVQI